MFKKVVITAALFVCIVLVAPQDSRAQDMSDVLARMDSIIAEMQKLRGEFALLAASVNDSSASAPTPAVLGSTAKKTLTMDLSQGAENEDIERIQRLLSTDPEIYDHPYVTGFFGPKTEEAIRNFQTRFGLDPVGVIGPATTALLEVFFNAYPDENYPDGVLANKPAPAVQGASTATVPTPTIPASNIGAARLVDVEMDRGEAEVKIIYSNGNRRNMMVTGDNEDDVIDAIVKRTPLSRSDVEAVIEFAGFDSNKKSKHSSNDNDEGDADDALDDADNAIGDADDEIDSADEDGEDIDWAKDTLRDAKDLLDDAENAYDDEDWDEAVDKADEAKDLAHDAEDRIGEEQGDNKGDSDEIDTITAEVDEDESEITVEYDSNDDYVFTVEEDKQDEIIDTVAEELDIRSRDVEDFIEFDYGSIDTIDALVNEDDDETKVTIEFDSGLRLRFTVDSADEDDVIGETADYINERESRVEDKIRFDY